MSFSPRRERRCSATGHVILPVLMPPAQLPVQSAIVCGRGDLGNGPQGNPSEIEQWSADVQQRARGRVRAAQRARVLRIRRHGLYAFALGARAELLVRRIDAPSGRVPGPDSSAGRWQRVGRLGPRVDLSLLAWAGTWETGASGVGAGCSSERAMRGDTGAGEAGAGGGLARVRVTSRRRARPVSALGPGRGPEARWAGQGERGSGARRSGREAQASSASPTPRSGRASPTQAAPPASATASCASTSTRGSKRIPARSAPPSSPARCSTPKAGSATPGRRRGQT